MDDSHRDRDREDLAVLVSDLEATLADLRAELDGRNRSADAARDRSPRRDRRDRDGRRVGRTRRERSDDTADRDRRSRRTLPRPPSVRELFGFTTDYTIPTVVAVLEATIEALELLRGVLELAAPGERPGRRGRDRRDRGRRGGAADRSMLSEALADGVTTATDRATADATDALTRLREALADVDLPEDERSRDLVADARELSVELERRVGESRASADRRGRRERHADRPARDRSGRSDDARDDGPVTIEVGDPGESGDGNGDDADADGDDDPEVDVDAELESIRREVGDRRDGRADARADDAGGSGASDSDASEDDATDA